MKRPIAFLLIGSAVIDIAQQAYSIDLLGSIAKRDAGTNILTAVAESPIVATIEHWAMFLLGFGLIALIMGVKKPSKPIRCPSAEARRGATPS